MGSKMLKSLAAQGISPVGLIKFKHEWEQGQALGSRAGFRCCPAMAEATPLAGCNGPPAGLQKPGKGNTARNPCGAGADQPGPRTSAADMAQLDAAPSPLQD